MSGPVLELLDVSVAHGPSTVLRGVALSVAAGGAVALLGRNGAGKTTLIHGLFGLGPRLAGVARLEGRDVAGWATHRIARRGAATVLQGRGVFAALSVRENLAVAALRAPPGPWTVPRVLDRFPILAGRLGTPAGALSGGERQMLAIGRALLVQPRLLVLDEPSEGLAPAAARDLVAGLVTELTANGTAVLLAEQNLPLAMAACPNAIVLSGGSVAFSGSTATLAADPGLARRLMGV